MCKKNIVTAKQCLDNAIYMKRFLKSIVLFAKGGLEL